MRFQGWPLYGLLAIPAFFMTYQLTFTDIYADELLHGSGEMSARLMILAMIATPLRIMFPAQTWTLWLIRNRRALGVAAFGYAALHTLFYIIDMQLLEDILAELGALGIWTGWLAFLIFLPLAVTSNDWSLRQLGHKWKWLHRLIYGAAVAVLVHWIFVHNNAAAAWIHFTPLLLLEVYRVYKKSFT